MGECLPGRGADQQLLRGDGGCGRSTPGTRRTRRRGSCGRRGGELKPNDFGLFDMLGNALDGARTPVKPVTLQTVEKKVTALRRRKEEEKGNYRQMAACCVAALSSTNGERPLGLFRNGIADVPRLQRRLPPGEDFPLIRFTALPLSAGGRSGRTKVMRPRAGRRQEPGCSPLRPPPTSAAFRPSSSAWTPPVPLPRPNRSLAAAFSALASIPARAAATIPDSLVVVLRRCLLMAARIASSRTDLAQGHGRPSPDGRLLVVQQDFAKGTARPHGRHRQGRPRARTAAFLTWGSPSLSVSMSAGTAFLCRLAQVAPA